MPRSNGVEQFLYSLLVTERGALMTQKRLFQKPEVSKENYSVPIIFFMAVFIAGAGFSSLGASLPDIVDHLKLSTSTAAGIPFALFCGGICGLLVMGFSLQYAKTLLGGSILLMFVATLAIVLIPANLTFLKISFFIFGGSVFILHTLPGIIVSRHSAGKGARIMNLLYAFFSAGVMMSPLIAAVTIAHRLTYVHFFTVIAVFSGAAGLVFIVSRFSCPDIGRGLVPAAINDLLKNHSLLFWVLFFMTLCYVGSEAAPNAWLPMYLRDTYPGGTPYRPNIILFLFWLAITVGRFVCAYILTLTQKRLTVLALLAGGAALCLAGAPAAENRIQTEILFIMTGFFYSGIFPIIIGYSEYLPNQCVGTFFILLIIAGAVGASLVAESVGLVADTLGFSWGMGIAAIICAVILPLIYLLSKAEFIKR